jgi:GNAT superfamily N-acetyltransferase
MSMVLKFMSKVEKFRALVPGALATSPLDLARDWPEVEVLLRQEEWPFVQADLELGEAQPGETSFIARKDGKLAGFFTAFMFGHVGYLDMFVIDKQFRGTGVARPLYFRVIEAMQQAGAKGLVAHTTNDSARLIKLMGFKPGRSFTMYVREPKPAPAGPTLGRPDRAYYERLDAEIFGVARPTWTEFLATDRRVDLVQHGDAVVALRPKFGEGFTMDQMLAPNPADIGPLVDGIVAKHGERGPIMVSCTTGGVLEGVLKERGFSVPDFFVPIGPLIEWRDGDTEPAGRSEAIQSLLWL